MVDDSDARGGAPAGARHRQWLPVLVSGLIIIGAVSLSTWFADRTFARGRGWDRYFVISPLPRPVSFPSPGTFFFVNGVLHSGADYYLGWYWAVALAGGYLVTVLWYRRAARRRGGSRLGRGLLASGAVATALALALPQLTRVVPALSGLWMHRQWVHGMPALLIIGVALAVTAWLDHSRGAALVLAGYAVVALLAGWLLLVPGADPVFRWLLPAGPGSGWPAAVLLDPLTVLVLPAVMLVTAGLAGFVRWRRASSLDAGTRPAG